MTTTKVTVVGDLGRVRKKMKKKERGRCVQGGDICSHTNAFCIS